MFMILYFFFCYEGFPNHFHHPILLSLIYTLDSRKVIFVLILSIFKILFSLYQFIYLLVKLSRISRWMPMMRSTQAKNTAKRYMFRVFFYLQPLLIDIMSSFDGFF